MHRVANLPKNTYYATSVTGPTQHLVLETMAVMTNGHVRVGTEDEPYLKPGLLGDNADHVARIARIAAEFGRDVSSVAETRVTLKVPRR